MARDLPALDAVELLAQLASRQLSAADLMQATLARISAVNPAVNAVVSLADADRLMDQAKAADATP